jgi:hypothetical protein
MIWHKVHYQFEVLVVDAFEHSLKFFHTVGDAFSQIGINVVIILNGIWRAGISLYYVLVVGEYAVGRIVSTLGMLYDTGEPHMRGAELLYGLKYRGGDVVEFTGTVLLYGAVWHRIGYAVGIKTRQKLINNSFLLSVHGIK